MKAKYNDKQVININSCGERNMGNNKNAFSIRVCDSRSMRRQWPQEIIIDREENSAVNCMKILLQKIDQILLYNDGRLNETQTV